MSPQNPPRPDLSFVEFVGLIALMMAMTAFAVDIMLPGLAQIGAELGLAEANDRQFIITFTWWGLPSGSFSSARYPTASDGFTLLALAALVAVLATERGRLARPQHAAAPPR